MVLAMMSSTPFFLAGGRLDLQTGPHKNQYHPDEGRNHSADHQRPSQGWVQAIDRPTQEQAQQATVNQCPDELVQLLYWLGRGQVFG
jgi:hypothetical protein